MRITVIIPTLNEENYIGKLLACLVNQTAKDFDVIVVDGGSRDATRQKVKEFEGRLNLRFLASPKKGVSFQRNYAASQSHSEYLLFMDADVTFENDLLKKTMSYIKEYPATDILSVWIKPDTNRLLYNFISEVFNRAVYMLRKRLPGAVGAFICIKKSVFDAVGGFNEHVRLGEDFDLVKRAHKKGFSFDILREAHIYFSTRRVEKLGTVRFFLIFGKAFIYYPFRYFFKDANWVNYNMEEGGAYYKNKDKID